MRTINSEDVWNFSCITIAIVFSILLISWSTYQDSSESIQSNTIKPTYYSNTESQYFNGYECTDDCSGHEAGYEWAEDNGITDPDDCDGNSNSFIEGCESYTEEYNDY